jgi:hypothetical protein
MQRLLLAISAVVVLSGVNSIVTPRAIAAGVNCSFDACLKECNRRGGTGNGCSKWCSDAMAQRKSAGQCKG